MDTGGGAVPPVTCSSIKDVLVTVKNILQGQPAQPSPNDMWHQEAQARASARQQQANY